MGEQPRDRQDDTRVPITTLEDLTPGAAIRGILPDGVVTVVSIQWFGSATLELTCKGPDDRVANELLYRHDEPRIEVLSTLVVRRRDQEEELAGGRRLSLTIRRMRSDTSAVSVTAL